MCVGAPHRNRFSDCRFPDVDFGIATLKESEKIDFSLTTLTQLNARSAPTESVATLLTIPQWSARSIPTATSTNKSQGGTKAKKNPALDKALKALETANKRANKPADCIKVNE